MLVAVARANERGPPGLHPTPLHSTPLDGCRSCPPTHPPTCRQRPGKSPHGSDGLWGSEGETPSFLYAMPLGDGGGSSNSSSSGGNSDSSGAAKVQRVFLEETCLVARPALPFATLKRRLERRCRALGIKVRALG